MVSFGSPMSPVCKLIPVGVIRKGRVLQSAQGHASQYEYVWFSGTRVPNEA